MTEYHLRARELAASRLVKKKTELRILSKTNPLNTNKIRVTTFLQFACLKNNNSKKEKMLLTPDFDNLHSKSRDFH